MLLLFFVVDVFVVLVVLVVVIVDIVISVVAVGPRNLILKFSQNWVSNS